MFVDVTTYMFISIGNDMMGWRQLSSSASNLTTAMRQFRSAFGINLLICRHVWNMIGRIAPHNIIWLANPKYLLWAFLFLKRYDSTEINAAIAGVDEKTYRKWSWAYIELIAELDVVSNILYLYYYYDLFFSTCLIN